MRNGKERVERRKHRRFEVSTGVFVAFRPHDGKLGEIIDISMGGLAFRYLATTEPSNGSHKLKIFLTESDFCLNDVLFETVSDFGTDQIPFTSITMRRSGVQFSKMTPRQVSQLERFIDSHAEDEV
jgi:c-di-GMP-binding flagellar brake protein YcgR